MVWAVWAVVTVRQQRPRGTAVHECRRYQPYRPHDWLANVLNSIVPVDGTPPLQAGFQHAMHACRSNPHRRTVGSQELSAWLFLWIYPHCCRVDFNAPEYQRPADGSPSSPSPSALSLPAACREWFRTMSPAMRSCWALLVAMPCALPLGRLLANACPDAVLATHIAVSPMRAGGYNRYTRICIQSYADGSG